MYVAFLLQLATLKTFKVVFLLLAVPKEIDEIRGRPK